MSSTTSRSIPGETVCATLRWDSWPTSADDFDLHLWDFASADNRGVFDEPSGAGRPPFEAACCMNPGSVPASAALVICDDMPDRGSPRFDLFYDGFDIPEYLVSAGSIVEPATSPNAFAVGAICWQSDTLEPIAHRARISPG